MKPNSSDSRTGLTACVVVINCAVLAGILLTPICSALSQQQKQEPSADTKTDYSDLDKLSEPELQRYIYSKFREGFGRQTETYKLAKYYLHRFPNAESARYFKTWVEKYEKATRKTQLQQLMRDGKHAEAFAIGKQILAEEPEDLQTLIETSYAGLRVAIEPDASGAIFSEAPNFAKKTIGLIQAGKTPGNPPFEAKDKDNTLGWLNYSLGIYTIKINPAEAANYFYEAARHEGSVKNDPYIYVYLARAYAEGDYKKLSTYFRRNGKPESPETKAALDRLYHIIDCIIDAYARAVALNATNLELRQEWAEWMQQLTEIYKFRYNSANGLDEFIGQVLSKPLPSPHDPSMTETKGRQ